LAWPSSLRSWRFHRYEQISRNPMLLKREGPGFIPAQEKGKESEVN
jgi:hypothetical protein